jgi:glyoxylate reductase
MTGFTVMFMRDEVELPQILITRSLPEEGLLSLEGKAKITIWEEDSPIPRDILLQQLPGKDALICLLNEKMDREAIDRGSDLKVIANYAVGYDNIDVDYATKKGIPVLNTPGVLTDATADLAFALLLSSARRIGESERYVREGKFDSWGPKLMLGKDVWGGTLGVIGAGKIGSAVLRRGKGFGMKLLYHSKTRKPEIERDLGAEYLPLKELLERSDFVSINCPLTEETYHLIGREELELMKKDSILINTARGPVVDEKALFEALRDGIIRAAGLDVFEEEPSVYPPMMELDNVVMVPHIGSSTTETRRKMAEMVSGGVIKVLKGEMPENIVNPELNRRGEGPAR